MAINLHLLSQIKNESIREIFIQINGEDSELDITLSEDNVNKINALAWYDKIKSDMSKEVTIDIVISQLKLCINLPDKDKFRQFVESKLNIANARDFLVENLRDDLINLGLAPLRNLKEPNTSRLANSLGKFIDENQYDANAILLEITNAQKDLDSAIQTYLGIEESTNPLQFELLTEKLEVIKSCQQIQLSYLKQSLPLILDRPLTQTEINRINQADFSGLIFVNSQQAMLQYFESQLNNLLRENMPSRWATKKLWNSDIGAPSSMGAKFLLTTEMSKQYEAIKARLSSINQVKHHGLRAILLEEYPHSLSNEQINKINNLDLMHLKPDITALQELEVMFNDFNLDGLEKGSWTNKFWDPAANTATLLIEHINANNSNLLIDGAAIIKEYYRTKNLHTIKHNLILQPILVDIKNVKLTEAQAELIDLALKLKPDMDHASLNQWFNIQSNNIKPTAENANNAGRAEVILANIQALGRAPTYADLEKERNRTDTREYKKGQVAILDDSELSKEQFDIININVNLQLLLDKDKEKVKHANSYIERKLSGIEKQRNFFGVPAIKFYLEKINQLSNNYEIADSLKISEIEKDLTKVLGELDKRIDLLQNCLNELTVIKTTINTMLTKDEIDVKQKILLNNTLKLVDKAYAKTEQDFKYYNDYHEIFKNMHIKVDKIEQKFQEVRAANTNPRYFFRTESKFEDIPKSEFNINNPIYRWLTEEQDPSASVTPNVSISANSTITYPGKEFPKDTIRLHNLNDSRYTEEYDGSNTVIKVYDIAKKEEQAFKAALRIASETIERIDGSIYMQAAKNHESKYLYAAFVALGYGKRLHISGNYDPRQDKSMESFVAKLSEKYQKQISVLTITSDVADEIKKVATGLENNGSAIKGLTR